MSSKDSDGTPTVRIINDNIEIMDGNKTSGIIKKLFNSFLQKYQEGLEESLRGSEFVFDSVDFCNIKFKK